MQPRLSPLQNARRFIFSEDDCLYRDHFGRRVVADIEAGGIAWIEVSNCPLLAYTDEVPASGFQWEFEKSFTVVANGPGDLQIEYQSRELHAVAKDLVKLPRERVTLPFAGSGYLLSFSGNVVVDQNQRLTAVGGPVPFFFSLAGQGEAEVIPCSTEIELIDSFVIDDVAALKERGFVAQNMSKVSVLDSCFPDGTRRQAAVASHLNPASWRLDLPSSRTGGGGAGGGGVSGILLVRTYDRFHGRQRARVFVDDQFIGYWYEPEQDRNCRWHMSSFGIPEQAIAGKTSIRITIDPPPGTPLWSISRMEAYALYDG